MSEVRVVRRWSRRGRAEAAGAGLGQMVTGIANEINNPLAFVTATLSVLRRDVGALARLLRMHKELEATLPADGQVVSAIHDFSEQIDLEYTLRDAADI